MRKRSLALHLVLGAALAALLAACGSPDPTATPRPAATATPSQPGAAPDPGAAPTQPTDPDFDAEAYFRGRTVRFVSISPPGGGTDIQARVIAAQFSQFMPGNPRLVVTNIARVAGHNYMWNATPDGYTIEYHSSPALERQLQPDAEFQMEEFRMIAGIGAAPDVWVITEALPYNTIEEIMGSSGPVLRFAEAVGDPENFPASPLVASFLCDRLNMPCEALPVSDAGTNMQMLMMDRGEINGNLRGSLWWNLATLRPGDVAAGKYKGIIAAGPPDNPGPPHPETDWVPPNAYEYLSEADRDHYALLAYPNALFNKAMGAPRNTPDHIMQVYRTAFRDAIMNDEFNTALSNVAGFDARETYQPGEELEPLYQETSRLFVAQQADYARLQQEMFDKYWRR